MATLLRSIIQRAFNESNSRPWLPTAIDLDVISSDEVLPCDIVKFLNLVIYDDKELEKSETTLDRSGTSYHPPWNYSALLSIVIALGLYCANRFFTLPRYLPSCDGERVEVSETHYPPYGISTNKLSRLGNMNKRKMSKLLIMMSFLMMMIRYVFV